MTGFDRSKIATEIAEVIGMLPPRPAGYITIAEYAEDLGISRSSARRYLQAAVKSGKLERLKVMDNGRREWVFRVKP